MVGSTKVAEFGETTALVEVYQTFSESAGKVFFDVVCVSECVEGSKRYLSPLSRVERVPHMVLAVLDSMTYIADRHKEIRDAAQPSVSDKYATQCFSVQDIDPAAVREEVSQFKEFKKGAVVVELVVEEKGGVEIFSVCCWREHTTSSGGRERKFFIQQRDLRDLCSALLKSWLYMQENLGSTPVTSGRRW